jgi:hypothetical protein
VGEFESTREIASRLVAEHREKKRNTLSAFLDQVPPDVLGALAELKQNSVNFTEWDLDWMKRNHIKP